MSGPPAAEDVPPAYPWKRALVIGGTSGIGEAVVGLLAAAGARVAVVGRREEILERLASEHNTDRERVLPFPHDVRNTADIPALFQRIVGCLGGLDLVVYSAGILPAMGPLEFSADKDLDIIAINLSGAVAWLDEAADRFTRAGRGTIIGVSSVAGDRGRRRNPVYNASKAGLDTYLEALRHRLAARGIRVVTAKPGYVQTSMLENNPPGPLPVSAPQPTARAILAAAAAGKRVVYIPTWWRVIMAVTRAIPRPIFERLAF